MQNNYIFNSIDLDKCKIHTSSTDLKKWKKRQKKKSKKNKNKNLKRRNNWKKSKVPQNYKEYIKSHWWITRRNKYYQTHKRVCQACLSTKHTNLHHMLYEDLGNEKDEHLIPLCRECHEEYHASYGVKNNMIFDTHQFIINKRGSWFTM
jgi:hypothetical protein